MAQKSNNKAKIYIYILTLFKVLLITHKLRHLPHSPIIFPRLSTDWLNKTSHDWQFLKTFSSDPEFFLCSLQRIKNYLISYIFIEKPHTRKSKWHSRDNKTENSPNKNPYTPAINLFMMVLLICRQTMIRNLLYAF